jgi:TetR/AcrR family transcriptional repressor of nem operon
MIEATKRDARTKLLDAARAVIRAKGFSATSVDDLCRVAGVTKGAFFHHFPTKDALGVAAAEAWADMADALFSSADFHTHADPGDRILAYVDFRRAILVGATPDYTCLVGTMVQEAYDTSPAIRAACEASIVGHARTLEPDLAAALAGGGRTDIDAMSLALHTQAVIQGAFVLAKARGGPAVAADSLAHLRRYLEFLFHKEEAKHETHTGGTTA